MDQPALLLPLTPSQQRMWHLCTAYEGRASPIVVLAWRMRGPLDGTALRESVAAVVDRHPNLRSRFVIRDGRPWQVTDPVGRFEVERIEVGGDTDAATKLVCELSEALLDLERDALVRSRLIRLGDEDHVWCFAAHHLLADGASMELIAGEVSALYQGTVLPDPPTPTRQEPDDDALAWWVRQLRDVPVLDWGRSRPAVKTASSAHLDHRLDDDLAGALEGLARRERATLFMVLLSGYQSMLLHLTRRPDFAVGSPVDGRVEVEHEDAVGLFANMVALRTDLSGDPAFRELLARNRRVVIDALSRQHIPFGRIVAGLDLPADRSRTEVFQTIMTLHTEQGSIANLPGVTLEPFVVGSPQVLHDVVLDAWRGPAGISLAFRYDTSLFTVDTVAGMARRFEAVLRAAVADPDAPLSALEVPS